MFREAGIAIDWAASEEINFSKLQAGRFDLVLADENAAAFLFRHAFEPQQARLFRSLDTPVYRAENVMLVNRGAADVELLARFNRALETIRKNGTYERIVKAHQLLLAE